MSRKAARFTQAEADFATLPSGEMVPLSRAAVKWLHGTPDKIDGRAAENRKRVIVKKRVPAEKGAAIRALLPPDVAADSLTADTFVYFLLADGVVKIGYSKDVKKRVIGMKTAFHGNAEILYVVRGGRSLERYLHERFAAQRLGGEWFRYRPAIANFLEGLPPSENDHARKWRL